MEALTEDHRTDLYSLGIVFWTLLVGRGTMPFEGGHLELLHAIVQKRPPPVHEVRRDVPMVLALIIEKVRVCVLKSSVPWLFLFVNTKLKQTYLVIGEKPGCEVSECIWTQGGSVAMSTTLALCGHFGDKRGTGGELYLPRHLRHKAFSHNLL